MSERKQRQVGGQSSNPSQHGNMNNRNNSTCSVVGQRVDKAVVTG